MRTFVSDISQKHFPISERVSGDSIRLPLLTLIQKDHPDFDHSKYISISELSNYREQYISQYLTQEVGKLSAVEKKVLNSIKKHSIIVDRGDDIKSTFGQRIADKVASFGGSWKFILTFVGFLLAWIAFNAFWLMNKGFDPYPFILLNLILSCLAALQAPVIMMSQNRQAEKDRQHVKEDYMVNLKSEIEIRTLHEKIDHMMIYQQQELLEIQKIQIEMLNDIIKEMEKRQSAKPSTTKSKK